MPSSHAQLLAAVAEVTGHDVHFIWSKMPLAQARQYEQLFFAKHEIDCAPFLSGGGGGLKTKVG